MKYQTTIDTVSIQIDLQEERKREGILDNLLSLLRNNNLYIEHNGYSTTLYSNFYVQEYKAYANKVVMVSIKVGSYSYRDRYTGQILTIYYIALKFAGIQRYDEHLDKKANELLFGICAYLNRQNIIFKLTGLDVALDLFTDFSKVLALCTKKSPTTTYYAANEAQIYHLTTYIEKLSQYQYHKAVQKAYLYDKSAKEQLAKKLTRFEVKLQSLFFQKNRYNNIAAIIKALDKYHVMYVPQIKQKQYLMDAYDKHHILRQRDIKKIGFDDYRCYYDIPVIVNFIKQLYTV